MIEETRARFETGLLEGRKPRIEDHLAGVAERSRPPVFRELLAAELEWLRGRGERPDPEEYAQRFPGWTELIESAFAELAIVDRTSPAWLQPRPGTQVRETLEAPRAGSEPMPGYRLVRLLGRGGFGEVWQAEAPGGLPVALKFVTRLDGAGMAELRALETIKGIRHPNLLALFGAWRVDDSLIIGMELADCTLMDRLERARAEGLSGIPAGELIESIAEAAKGIDYLNEHTHALGNREGVGVQHRDIKPQNILMVGGGVKVADFGLARLLDRSVTGHTGSLTPAYAAPEFFLDQTSDRSDQYSLAVTYCILRGGRLPFSGATAAVIAGHLHRAPDLTMLPERERPAVARALSKEPDQRWPSCRAFVQDVRDNLGVEATLAVRRSSSVRAGTPCDGQAAVGSLTKPPGNDSPSELGRRSPSGFAWRGVMTATLIISPPTLGLVVWHFGLIPPVTTQGGPGPRRDPQRDRNETPAMRKATSRTMASLQDPRMVGHGAGARGPREEVGTPPRTESSQLTAFSASPFLEEARRSYDSGDYDAAIVAYSEAIERTPSDAMAYTNRGVAYYKRELYDAAIEDFDRAIELDPSRWETVYNRGNAHVRKGRYEEAIRDYDSAARLSPRSASIYANRAVAHGNLGNRSLAAIDREQAARLEGP